MKALEGIRKEKQYGIHGNKNKEEKNNILRQKRDRNNKKRNGRTV